MVTTRLVPCTMTGIIGIFVRTVTRNGFPPKGNNCGAGDCAFLGVTVTDPLSCSDLMVGLRFPCVLVSPS